MCLEKRKRLYNPSLSPLVTYMNYRYEAVYPTGKLEAAGTVPGDGGLFVRLNFKSRLKAREWLLKKVRAATLTRARLLASAA